MSVILVTGGARCGKSRFAEALAARGPLPVLYVATAEAGDDEMAARIAEHRRRRPTSWRTLEAPADVGAQIAGQASRPGTVLLDDLGLLVTNRLVAVTGDGDPTPFHTSDAEHLVEQELDALLAAQAAGGWSLIVVTNEVGLGLVPGTPLGRAFRDLLGRANQALAARADRVYLLVAGIPVRIKPACACAAPGS